MTVNNIINPPEFIEYFDYQIRTSLHDRELYSVDGYGWLNEQDTDPEYEGYALWSTDPKVEYDFDAHFNRKPFSVKPINIDIEMVTNGHDFMEVMNAAWLTLGQALFFQTHSSEKEALNFSYISVSIVSAIILLSTATDRLKDFLVIAVTRRSPVQKREPFTQFFEELHNRCQKSNALHDVSSRILELTKAISPKRQKRNELIHRLTSNNALLQKVLLSEQRRLFDLEPGERVSETKEFQYLEASLENSVQWYRELINLANSIFIFEHRCRKPT